MVSYIWFILQNGYLIALQVGLLFGFVMMVMTLDLSLRRQTHLYAPAQYQKEKLDAHPPGPGEFAPDLAWPLYTLRQAGVDKKLVRQNLHAFQRRVWRWPVDTFLRGRHGPRWAWWIFLLPVTASVLLFCGGSVLTSWLSYGTYWAVLTVFQFTDRTVILALRGQMRVREARRRETLHTAAACMNCLHVTPWPAYACPGCGRLHHDVLPGDLGTFFRKCGQCHAKFPTLPSRAAWHTTAICKRCGRPLPEGAGAVRDIRVPVFGDTAAGKTRFLYASLNSLLLDLDHAHVKYYYLDEPSRVEAELRLKAIRANEDVPKTTEAPATAISLRLREGRHSDFIHLFDAAGEQFSKPGNWDFEHGKRGTNYGSLRFVEDGQALAYVLDPFSVDLIRDQAAAHDQALVAQVQSAQKDPELSYTEVVNRLRGNGVPIGSQRLAVVVSKADLLRRAGLVVPTKSDDIADWLAENGVHNLVLAARREFAEVRFFTVASLNGSASRIDDPGIPLCWLLAAYGVRLPARAVAHSRHAPIPEGEPAVPERPPVAVGHGTTAERPLKTAESVPTPSEHPGYGKTGVGAAPGAGGTGEPGEGDSGQGSGGTGAGTPLLPQPPRHLIGSLPERAPTGRRISLIVRIGRTAAGTRSVPLERLSVPAEGRDDVTITVSAPDLMPLRRSRTGHPRARRG